MEPGSVGGASCWASVDDDARRQPQQTAFENEDRDVVPSIYAIRVNTKGPISGREKRLEPYTKADSHDTLAPRSEAALKRLGSKVYTLDPHEVVRLLRTGAYRPVLCG